MLTFVQVESASIVCILYDLVMNSFMCLIRKLNASLKYAIFLYNSVLSTIDLSDFEKYWA